MVLRFLPMLGKIVTASENAPTAIQGMDAKTGAVLYTTKLPEKSYPKRAVRYKDGIVIDALNKFYNISTAGTLINTFSLR